MAEIPAGHGAATGGIALCDRSHRRRWAVTGKSPVEMLNGILTCAMPPEPEPVEEGVVAGRAHYGLALTPKGKIVADVRVMTLGGSLKEGLLLDVARGAAEGLDEHFGRYLPPRLARREDRSEALGMLTVLGPEAPGPLAREALGLRVDAEALSAMEAGEYRMVGGGMGEGVCVLRTDEVGAPAWDLIADAATLRGIRERLVAGGAASVGREVWEVLRVEAGTPAFGSELGPDVLPQEAGLEESAIDHRKGCYTGQEVVVRIRDRGKVNRHLRRLVFGGDEVPKEGAELVDDSGSSVGRVTSAVWSVREGGPLGLGFVRREMEVGDEVRVGGPDGARARVEERR